MIWKIEQPKNCDKWQTFERYDSPMYSDTVGGLLMC